MNKNNLNLIPNIAYPYKIIYSFFANYYDKYEYNKIKNAVLKINDWEELSIKKSVRNIEKLLANNQVSDTFSYVSIVVALISIIFTFDFKKTRYYNNYYYLCFNNDNYIFTIS